jgi:hypothetical protein
MAKTIAESQMPFDPLVKLLVIGGAFAFMPLAAQQPTDSSTTSSDMSIAFRVGTPGLGLEASKLLTGHLGVRVGGSFFSDNLTRSESGINYSGSVKLHTFSGLIDLYPGRRGSFHFTVGIVTNPLTASGVGQPSSGDVTINGKPYTSAQVGTLNGVAKFKAVGPYVGVGFGTPATRGSALKFVFDLGAVIGQPTVSLSATGGAFAQGSLPYDDLQAQQMTTQQDLNKVKAYPVISFGLAYCF